jgi:hypothetical protein
MITHKQQLHEIYKYGRIEREHNTPKGSPLVGKSYGIS